MKMKSLILGGAALMAATGAQAADLGQPAPVAVDYVKVCDAYGAGFFYIPGSETCLKLSGYVRAQYRVGDSDALYNWGGRRQQFVGPFSWDDNRRDRNGSGSFARGLLDIDARTNTEFGLLRSMIEVYWTVVTGSQGAVATSLDLAFVQWGGLTAGRAQSFYDFWTGYALNDIFGQQWSDQKVNTLAYTFAFGNGVSATVAIEDPTTNGARRRTGTIGGEAVIMDTDPRFLPRNGLVYGGLRYPDVVANLNITQAWGAAQVMAAAHHLNPTTNNVNDDWGWAVGAGVQVNLPMLGAGDKIALQGNYSEGAISYANGAGIGPNQLEGSGAVVSGQFPNQTGSLANIGADAVVKNANGRGNLGLTTAWSVATGFRHNFSPAWRVDFNAGYTDVDGFGARDFAVVDIAGDIRWSPVAGLSFTAEVEYRNVDFTSATTRAFSSPGNIANVSGNRRLSDGDAWVGVLRIQRDF